MPNAKNESPVTGRIADFLLQRLIAVYGIKIQINQNFSLSQSCHYVLKMIEFLLCNVAHSRDIERHIVNIEISSSSADIELSARHTVTLQCVHFVVVQMGDN